MTLIRPWPDPIAPTNVGKWPSIYRVYPIPGVGQLPSVTAIEKVFGFSTEGLIKWAANEEHKACMESAGNVFARWEQGGPGEFIAAVEAELGPARKHQKLIGKAADIGSSIHQAIQRHLRLELGLEVGPDLPLPDQALWAFMAWQDWYKASGLRVVRVEQVLYDETLGYAGCTDAILENPKGQLEVWDWKSSKGIYLDHHIQLSAYVAAARLFDDAVVPGGICRVPKQVNDPAFEAVPLGQIYGGLNLTEEQLFTVFKNGLSTFNLVIRR